MTEDLLKINFAHYVSAIDDYTKAIELNPDVAEYFFYAVK